MCKSKMFVLANLWTPNV